MPRKAPWERYSGYDPRGWDVSTVNVEVDGEERWTVHDQRTGDSVCHILCNSTMSTETLFDALSLLLLTAEDVAVPAEHLWFGTKLNTKMAQDIDALEMLPYFDVRHQKLLVGEFR